MTRPGEPTTVQLSVVDWPAITVAGVALKLAMAGRLPTMTETVAETAPEEFAALRV
jgi:hypothetical protein